jgi:protein-disulfide isomerase
VFFGMLCGVNRNRLLLAAAAVGAAAIVVIVLVLLGGGTGSSTAANSSTGGTDSTGTTTTAVTAATFAGVPQHGDTLGDPKAPATLLVFEDPQCPYCRSWNLGTLPTVVDDYVRTARLKLVYRGIQIIGPNSQKGLRALYAAGKQDKLWNVAEALYRVQGGENSGWITDAVIRDAATAAGANPTAVLKSSASPTVTAALRQAAREAVAARVPGTPTFVLQRPPGLPRQLSISGLDPTAFESGLSQALQ